MNVDKITLKEAEQTFDFHLNQCFRITFINNDCNSPLYLIHITV